jgi:hypothetical protein
VTARPDLVARSAAEGAVLLALHMRGFAARGISLPEGGEIEVPCAPKVPVQGARFFLRVEVAAPQAGNGETPRVPLSSALLLAWRGVPEPVAVVALDPRGGAARLGEVHPFLAELDRAHRGWERRSHVSFPLPHALDGPTLLRLARAAADEHVLFRRVVDAMRRGPGAAAPVSARESDFAHTVACLDLLRETGMVEQDPTRGPGAASAVVEAFSRAAVQHGVGARGHLDPVTAAEAGRAAVARVLLSRLPACAETTLARCAVLLARLLPVDDADAILALASGDGDDGAAEDDGEE